MSSGVGAERARVVAGVRTQEVSASEQDGTDGAPLDEALGTLANVQGLAGLPVELALLGSGNVVGGCADTRRKPRETDTTCQSVSQQIALKYEAPPQLSLRTRHVGLRGESKVWAVLRVVWLGCEAVTAMMMAGSNSGLFMRCARCVE